MRSWRPGNASKSFLKVICFDLSNMSPWAGMGTRCVSVFIILPTIPTSAEYGLLTADYGLQTADYGVMTADHGVMTADYGVMIADYRLIIAR